MIQILILTASVTSFGIVYFVFKGGIKSRLNKSFSLFVFSIGIWALVNFFSGMSDNGLLIKLTFGVGAFIPSLTLLWIANFTSKGRTLNRRWRNTLSTFFSISVIFLILSLFTNTIAIGNSREITLGSLFIFYTLFLLTMIVIPITLMIKFYFNNSGLLRLQAMYILVGISLFGILTFIFSFILPLVGYQSFGRLDSVSSLFFIFLSAYAIIKHRLMDIRIIIRKSAVYFGALATVMLIGLGLMMLNVKIFQNVIPAMVSGPLVLLIGVILFNPVKNLYLKTANKYFFASLYNYQETLENLAQELTHTIDLNQIIDSIVGTIKGIMKLDRAGVLLFDEQTSNYQVKKTIGFTEANGISLVRSNFLTSYLSKNRRSVLYQELDSLPTGNKEEKSEISKLKSNMKLIEASICLPLLIKDKLIGIIVLGEKISKEAYTKEDIDLLTTLSNQASVAIENARLYQQVQDFNKNLQAKVNEQTQDIKNKNIRLEKLLQIRSEFLDIASHQLRTPVSLIRGVLSMIRDGDLEKLPKAKQAQFIENAWQKGAKLDTIINDILAASELDTQKFQVDAKTPAIQLEEVVDKVIQDSQMEAEKRGIELKWQKPKQLLAQVQGYANFLEQALANLVGNALKYTPSTKMVKEARTQREAKGIVEVLIKQEANNLVVSVKDNGIGIPKDEIPKLFDKFARASNATAMYTDGSGLGLFIVKEIVDGHRGKVWVESEINKGSVFYLSLPIAKQ